VLPQTLRGLEKVTTAAADLRKALTEGGKPCQASWRMGRFEKHCESVTRL
jgi:hypothetical protein